MDDGEKAATHLDWLSDLVHSEISQQLYHHIYSIYITARLGRQLRDSQTLQAEI